MTEAELVATVKRACRNELRESWLDEHGNIRFNSLAGKRFQALLLTVVTLTEAWAAERELADEVYAVMMGLPAPYDVDGPGIGEQRYQAIRHYRAARTSAPTP